ncbi:ras GTPase-activating protein 3-like isoform X2 [Branchiostoma floridae x Branchiostoma belcheri]
MAGLGEGEVRVVETLRVKIGEGKNFGASTGPVGTRDTFCTVSLDQEEVVRTKTVERAQSAFFGEEFQFEVPRPFRVLSFYVYEKDLLKRDSCLGKACIRKEELHRYHGKDHWFSLTHVDQDSEVQGQVHVEVRLTEIMEDAGKTVFKVSARVLECSGLAIINGCCDPYANVTFCTPNRTENKKTKVRKKTTDPHFDETFYFELNRPSPSPDNRFSIVDEDIDKTELRVSLWHSSNYYKFADVFLGEVKIPLSTLDMTRPQKLHKAWYLLQPRDSTRPSKPCQGSLRLNINYTEDHIFPSHYYDSLCNLLLKSPDVDPLSSSAVNIYGEVMKDKLEEAARPLVRLFLHHGSLLPLISALADREVAKMTDPNTLFRGNSLLTKCVDEVMKLTGMHYLHVTIKKHIDDICEDHKPCEIDATRVKEGENLQINLENLRVYVERMFKSITESARLCPTIMSEVFFTLKESAIRHFPDVNDVRYTAVSGFVFLRLFAPAILGPRLFQLREEHPDPTTARTLTLISKTIQSLGNLANSSSVSPGLKEAYMSNIYDCFAKKEYSDAVKTFLDVISSTGRPHSRSIDTPVVLKESLMIKRAQGRTRFGLKNFKRRWFCLTNKDLTYAKSKELERNLGTAYRLRRTGCTRILLGEPPLCKIPVEDILAVEGLQEESFKMKNMFQVVQPQRALYIQANNCVEAKEWIDILNKVSQCNKKRLKTYHPAAYVNCHWLCCKEGNENATGCTPVTGGVPADIKLDIDSDREMERIHSFFLTHRDRLEKLEDMCGEEAVYSGTPSTPRTTTYVIEDPKTCFETLRCIMDCIIKLEQEHIEYYKALAKSTKYGSEQKPIGGDGVKPNELEDSMEGEEGGSNM